MGYPEHDVKGCYQRAIMNPSMTEADDSLELPGSQGGLWWRDDQDGYYTRRGMGDVEAVGDREGAREIDPWILVNHHHGRCGNHVRSTEQESTLWSACRMRSRARTENPWLPDVGCLKAHESAPSTVLDSALGAPTEHIPH